MIPYYHPQTEHKGIVESIHSGDTAVLEVLLAIFPILVPEPKSIIQLDSLTDCVRIGSFMGEHSHFFQHIDDDRPV